MNMINRIITYGTDIGYYYEYVYLERGEQKEKTRRSTKARISSNLIESELCTSSLYYFQLACRHEWHYYTIKLFIGSVHRWPKKGWDLEVASPGVWSKQGWVRSKARDHRVVLCGKSKPSCQGSKPWRPVNKGAVPCLRRSSCLVGILQLVRRCWSRTLECLRSISPEHWKAMPMRV